MEEKWLKKRGLRLLDEEVAKLLRINEMPLKDT
jgi:hypothetical protein